jgi:CheY-like chemotaxis protein
MSEETCGLVFDPFFTTKSKGIGTGFGLATCYGIALQNAGTVHLRSKIGEGTTFYLEFPAALAHPHLEKARAPSKESTAGMVLLVEDDKLVRKASLSTMKSIGLDVLSACDGIEALDVLERESARIDLVVTDVVMPRMGGAELYGEMQKRWPEIEVLFVSGNTEESIDRGGLLSGKMNFLQKPYSFDQLAKKISGLLGKPSPI